MQARHRDHPVHARYGDRLQHLPLTKIEDEQLTGVHVRDVEPPGRRIDARVVESIARPRERDPRHLSQWER